MHSFASQTRVTWLEVHCLINERHRSGSCCRFEKVYDSPILLGLFREGKFNKIIHGTDSRLLQIHAIRIEFSKKSRSFIFILLRLCYECSELFNENAGMDFGTTLVKFCFSQFVADTDRKCSKNWGRRLHYGAILNTMAETEGITSKSCETFNCFTTLSFEFFVRNTLKILPRFYAKPHKNNWSLLKNKPHRTVLRQFPRITAKL